MGAAVSTDRGCRCPPLAAQLNGWQLEILCRIQTPQNELHVSLKEHPSCSCRSLSSTRGAGGGVGAVSSAGAAALKLRKIGN